MRPVFGVHITNSKGLFHIYVRVDMGEGLPHIPKIADFSVKCK